MDPFGCTTTPLALVVALAMAVRAQKRKTLTPEGAMIGCGMGFLITASGVRGLLLLFFYQLGSMASNHKKSIKEEKDATILKGTVARGGLQVVAVAITPVLLSLGHVWYCGKERPVDFRSRHEDDDSHDNTIDYYLASSLTCAILAHHATCLADTLASELGILSRQPPLLITQPWRRVPAGTNGGITILGIAVSLCGGIIIGALWVILDLLAQQLWQPTVTNAFQMILFGGVTGLIGSLLDSLIGATLQSSYFDVETKLSYHASSPDKPKSAKLVSGINLLTNEGVNFVSALITALLGGWLVGPWIFGTTT